MSVQLRSLSGERFKRLRILLLVAAPPHGTSGPGWPSRRSPVASLASAKRWGKRVSSRLWRTAGRLAGDSDTVATYLFVIARSVTADIRKRLPLVRGAGRGCPTAAPVGSVDPILESDGACGAGLAEPTASGCAGAGAWRGPDPVAGCRPARPTACDSADADFSRAAGTASRADRAGVRCPILTCYVPIVTRYMWGTRRRLVGCLARWTPATPSASKGI